MALSGAIGVRLDPVLGCNFLITLLDTSSTLATALSLAKTAVFDVALGGFSECTGLEMSLDVEEFREGGRNSGMLLFPKVVKWSKITLKKGVGIRQDLWDWHYGFVEGKGKRRDGLIVLLNDLHLPNNIWYFKRGLPAKYTGPSMNAAQSNVAIEAIEIFHEGIYQVPFVGAGAGVTTLVVPPVLT
jgi:phage tail-like protein